jgi:SAM-dependent methyltransferase
MLINEAKWIGNIILSLPITQESVILNFGSQSVKYNKENKHIMDFVIKPLSIKCQLRNLDIREGPGIDYLGNIFDDTFFSQLKQIQFDGILLCNVFEHVTDVMELAKRVCDLIKPGGFIIFTGPYEYPKHYDPIDNGFRPEIAEVESLFTGFEKSKGDIITDYTYSFYLFRNFKTLVVTLLRILTPFYKFKKWRQVVLPKLNWWNKKFKVTCVLMQKQ